MQQKAPFNVHWKKNTIRLRHMDIYTVDIAPGSVHDFELSKQSNLEVRDDIQLTGDKAYQGIQKIHANSLLPFKTSVKIEQVNAYLKGFKIISTRFRNSRSQYAKNKTYLWNI